MDRVYRGFTYVRLRVRITLSCSCFFTRQYKRKGLNEEQMQALTRYVQAKLPHVVIPPDKERRAFPFDVMVFSREDDEEERVGGKLLWK